MRRSPDDAVIALEAPAAVPTRRDKDGWGFAEGEEIVSGRRALSCLGGGSRYEVWLAIDERLLTVVAMKLLRPSHAPDDGCRKEMQDEAELLQSLHHPGIVRLLDVEPEGERPHMVLEHLDGSSLRRQIKRGGWLAPDQVLPLALHICSALHYLHGMGYVHLDIKPDNVIMASPPRMIDLSIARTFARAARTRGLLGTYAYMAPEQCLPGRRGTIGPAADVWGLGMILYEASTGRYPFSRKPRTADLPSDPIAREAFFPQLGEAIAPYPEFVPRALADTIDACLALDPDARPTPLEVALRLEELIAALPKTPVLRRRRPGWR